jgi:hypothetical protein
MKYEIKPITVVTGWKLNNTPGGKKVFDGHLDFDDALRKASSDIKVGDGAFVKVYHDIDTSNFDSWAGNYDMEEKS